MDGTKRRRPANNEQYRHLKKMVNALWMMSLLDARLEGFDGHKLYTAFAQAYAETRSYWDIPELQHDYDKDTDDKLLSLAYQNCDCSIILDSEVFFPDPIIGTIPPLGTVARDSGEPDVRTDSSMQATVKSWDQAFVGTAHNRLYRYMEELPKLGKLDPNQRLYARYLTIVQSSGMGKSRASDELSKTVFTIPMNLRDPRSDGYPPADKPVRSFLVTKSAKTQEEAFVQSCAFLTALFEETLLWLEQNTQSGMESKDVAAQFRLSMVEGMSYSDHGSFREKFYEMVAKRAESLMANGERSRTRSTSPTSIITFKDTGDQTSNQLVAGSSVESISTHQHLLIKLLSKLKEFGSCEGPQLILVFDEAYDLSQAREDRGWSRFSELRRALYVVEEENMFSLFLSTAGRLHHFTPVKSMDPSARIQRGKFEPVGPFVELDYDPFAKPTKADEYLLSTVESDEYLVTLGRPMFYTRYQNGNHEVKKSIVQFARDKVQGAASEKEETIHLAYLATRLPLIFNPLSNEATRLEHDLVASHMRVCLGFMPDLHSIMTVAPSEPLLAEGARLGMMAQNRNRMHIASKTMANLFDRLVLDVGTCGELTVALLLLQAQDKARVGCRSASLHEFLTCFLGKGAHQDLKTRGPSCTPGDDSSQGAHQDLGTRGPSCTPGDDSSQVETLKQRYPNARVWFNHFVHVHSFGSLTSKHLWAFLLRGAAIICAPNQPGFDVVVIFVCDSERPVGPSNTSVITVQVKNDFKYTEKPQLDLFDRMNPHRFGMLDHNPDHAVIRIVCALASRTAGCRMVDYWERPQTSIVTTKGENSNVGVRACRAYDFWCYGATRATYSCITEAEEPDYDRLLRLSLRRMPVYTTFDRQYSKQHTKDNERARRTMNPTDGSEIAHWSRWVELPSSAAYNTVFSGRLAPSNDDDGKGGESGAEDKDETMEID